MQSVAPSSLPPVDAVEVVDLRGIDADRVDRYMEAAASAPMVRVVGIEAERIATLWRALPAGEQSRCHIPPFGLRLYANGALLAQASICWQCNNIFGNAGTEELFFAFDALQPKSRELLAECERIIARASTK